MKKNKFWRSVVSWIFRLSIIVYLYLIYFPELKDGININAIRDLIILALGILALLLIIGGFMRKSVLTIVTSLIIITVIIIALFKGFVLEMLFYPFFISIYFLVYGNES